MEQILLGPITSQLKHVIRENQNGFTNGKSCLPNLISFCNLFARCVASSGHCLPGFLQGFWYGLPQPRSRETDVLWFWTSGLCGGWEID